MDPVSNIHRPISSKRRAPNEKSGIVKCIVWQTYGLRPSGLHKSGRNHENDEERQLRQPQRSLIAELAESWKLRQRRKLKLQNRSDHGGRERARTPSAVEIAGFCALPPAKDQNRFLRFWGLASKSQEARRDHGRQSLQPRDFAVPQQPRGIISLRFRNAPSYAAPIGALFCPEIRAFTGFCGGISSTVSKVRSDRKVLFKHKNGR